MSVNIFHTVNAGLYFYNSRQGLLIDGLHLGGGSFSETPAAFLDSLLSPRSLFPGRTDLAFTHLHEDHYDPLRVSRFLDIHCDAAIYLPNPSGSSTGPVCPAGNPERVSFGDFYLTAFPTVHEGPAFAAVPHRSFCLQAEGAQWVICGDAALDVPLAETLRRHCSRKTEAVFVNVYQLAAKGGQAFLNALEPEHIYLYHLPFPGEDPRGFRAMAAAVISRQPEYLRLRIRVPEPMSHITVSRGFP